MDDASYIKLRHILIRYQLPKQLLKNYKIDRLELRCQISNVGYWAANKEGYDPSYVSGNRFYLPTPTTYNFGVNVQF